MTPQSAGNVVAVGSLEELPFFVVKVSGSSGQELWRYDEADSAAEVVALTPSGDVIAAGPGRIVKLRGSDGIVLWERTGLVVYALQIDGSGNVFAAGHTLPDPDFAVFKLAGGDGTELWLYSLDGPVSHYDAALHVALDSAGDVVAVGQLSVELFVVDDIVLTRKDSHLVKLSSADGAVGWSRDDTTLELASGSSALAIGSTGDVYLTALRGNPVEGVVCKLSGSDGSDIWSVDTVAAGVGLDAAPGLALFNDALVVSAGLETTPNGIEWGVFALSQADGAERWLRSFHVNQAGVDSWILPEIAVDAQGGVVAAGSTARPRGVDLSVIRLGRAVRGQKVTWLEHDVDHQDGDLKLKLRDDSLFVPTAGGGGDPRLHGGVVVIANPTTTELSSIPLPAAGWIGLGDPADSKGYDYKDVAGAAGPCRRVRIRDGSLSALCRGNLDFSLDEPSQGAVTFAVRTGGQTSCGHFGGEIDADSGGPAEGGRFRAKNAPPSAACGNVP